MADIAASVLAKLKNKAKASGISYQQCLQLFFQEEFLRRLAGSKYAENFVLKGGLFIYTLTNFESRATVDVDFLMRGLNNDMARMDEIIAEILAVDTGNDFVTFKATKTEPIAVQRKYHGISTQITGYIKNVRVPFNVDIGVGDVIVPNAERRNIQTQLDGYEKPEILTYSLESTIAEKFDAILQRFELTGRMKDFYDIYYLSQTFDFDGLKLQTAIQETLQNRGTAYEKDSFDRVLTLADDADMQTKWRYFLKTLGNPEISFQSVIAGIDTFLGPIWNAILEEDEFCSKWDSATKKWEAKWERAMKKYDALDKKLSGATVALTRLASDGVLDRIAKQGNALMAAAKTVAEQTQKWERVLMSSTATQVLERLQQIDTVLIDSVQSAAKVLQSPSVLDSIAAVANFQNNYAPGAVAMANHMAKILKMYQTSSFASQMTCILEQLASLDTTLLEKARQFDWSLVEISDDDVISFDGVDYTPEELTAELNSEVAIVQKDKLTLREKVEWLEKKLWLLLMILNMLMTLPDVPEKIEFYCDTVAQIQEIYEEKRHICFTIKEQSILRKEANSNAARILYLPYDTPLEIIADIPRWYQVKYTDSEGIETTGWISKISVETES